MNVRYLSYKIESVCQRLAECLMDIFASCRTK